MKANEMEITRIIWNGVDGYMDIDSANARSGDYDIERHDNGAATLFTQREAFQSIDVVEVDKSTIPTDSDGEMILDGLYVTDDLRIFRQAVDEQKILDALSLLIALGRLAVFDPETSTMKMIESACMNGPMIQLNAEIE